MQTGRFAERVTVMTIDTLLAADLPALKPEDTVEHALGLMLEHSVLHLPVVNDEGILLGAVSEETLLSASGPDAPLERLLEEHPASQRPVSVSPDTHIFDITRKLVEHDLTVVPVVEGEGRFTGMIRRHDIFYRFARMLSTQERGAILALELDPRDYSLSQLVYTIENNGVKILSIASEPPESETDMIRVTLKLNTTDAARVRHMLEHYGYNVVASFSEDETDDELQLRVEEFMRYLEV